MNKLISSKIRYYLERLFSAQGFWVAFFSYFLGYFVVYWFFKIGFKSFDITIFAHHNNFANPSTYNYFIALTVFFQLAFFALYWINSLRQRAIERALKLSAIIFFSFAAISLVGSSNIYTKYAQLFIFALNLTILGHIFFGYYLAKIHPKYFKPVVIGSIAVFAILLGVLSILRHEHYSSHAYDLGLFSQVIYNYSRVGVGDSSIRGVYNILGDHFTPILVVLAPLYWLWANAKVLLIVQSILLAVSAWPLYLIAKLKLRETAPAFLIAIGYLLFVGIWKAAEFDFHEIAFFPLLFLSAFYFLEIKKYHFYWLFFLLSLLVKEDISAYFILFAVYLIFFRRLYKIGLITLFVSVLYFLGATKWAIPYFAHRSFEYFQFSSLGATFGQALKNVLLNPLYVYFTAVAPAVKMQTILSLFGSFGYLSFFAPIFVILSLPILAGQVLFDAPSHWELSFHYSLAIAPILVLGSIWGADYLANFTSRRNKLATYQSIIRFLAIFTLFSSLVIAIYAKSPMLNLLRRTYYVKQDWAKNIDEVVKVIPGDVSVIAQHNIVPHLSERRLIAPYPNHRSADRIPEPDYYVFSIFGYTFPSSGELEQIDIIKNLLENQKYGLYKQVGDAFVFKKDYHQGAELENNARKYLEDLKKSL